MNNYDIILKDANVIDEEGNVFYNKNILIKDGKIVKITENSEGNAKKVVNCKNYYVTPGLVNLHTHSPMGILRGLAEDVNINDWFNKEIFPYESKFKPEHVYYGALLGIHEMIDNGVTAFADHYFYADRICDAVIHSGIKGDIAPTVFGLGEGFEESLEGAAAIIENRRFENSRLKLRMGPHAPYTCPPDKLKKIVERAEELEVGLHIHVSETLEQVSTSIREYGKTPFQIIHEVGGFDRSVIVGHGLWIMEEDIKYINDDTFFAISPKTYMKLGMGMGSLWDLYKELPLCISTDGSASSNTLDPLEQLRLFALIGKMNNSPEEFTLYEMWSILMRGHKALDFNSGALKEGYSADLLIWDLNMSNTYPVHNPLASIIYSGKSKNIIHSIIDGKLVKENSQVLFMTEDVYKNIEYWSKDILERGKGKGKVSY